MEFSDLNDEIVSDDWLIPDEEIARRKLIKQTPSYNIYKADWFGDVLIYEPATNKCQHSAQRRQIHQDMLKEDLRSRLSKLNDNFDLKIDGSIQTRVSVLRNDSEETDSAYSSISSTPQYHTKNMRNNEFEFPSGLNSPTLSILSYQSRDEFFLGNQQIDCGETSSGTLQLEPQYEQVHSPIVLSRESFNFKQYEEKTSQYFCYPQSLIRKADGKNKQCSWSELNELRLIAHEGFMLFMGASMSETTTSLVMQMNHPRAISLFNLLHNNNKHYLNSNRSTSPLDRFFTESSLSKRQQLDLRAKLNICQQVTNAMTYLHDKNIVHAKLTSVNIYLEPNQRVKISLIDNDEREIAISSGSSDHSVQFNLTALTYLSPELIRTLCVSKDNNSNRECDTASKMHVQIDHTQFTTTSDVFSFGTLLFELFEERFPFSEVTEIGSNSPVFSYDILFPAHHSFSSVNQDFLPLDSAASDWNGNIKISAPELIFQIGAGQMKEKNLSSCHLYLADSKQESLKRSKRTPLVDYVLTNCWSTKPDARPSFKQLATLFCEQL